MTASVTPCQSPPGRGSLPADFGGWQRVANIGKVRQRTLVSGEVSYFIDFSPDLAGPDRRLYTVEGRRFESQVHAELILGEVRARLRPPQSMSVEDAVGLSRPPTAKPNLVLTKAALWLAEIHESSDLEPYTLTDYRLLVKNHWGHWDGKGMVEISYSELEAWRNELRAKGLAGTTIRKHVFAAFRSFLRWHRRRDPSFVVPEFPRVKLEKRQQPHMPLPDLARVLLAVPEAHRGFFLVNAYTMRRPNEIRALQVGDYDFKAGTLWIGAAMPTPSGRTARRETIKAGEGGEYPLGADARRWLEEHTPSERRFQRDAWLLPNPRTGDAYRMRTLQYEWGAACKAADVAHVPLYRSMKHSPGTALVEAGIALTDVQVAMGHAESSTTSLYIVDQRERRGRVLSELEGMMRGPNEGQSKAAAEGHESE